MTTFRNPVELVPKVVERIVSKFDPVQILMFGSQARGDARSDSDVDLLVILDDVENKASAMGQILDSFSDVPLFVDVIVTTPDEVERRGDLVGSVIRYARREGRVLYDRRAVS